MKESAEKITLLAVYHAIEGLPRPNQNFCSCCDKCPFGHCIFDTVLEDSARDFMNYLSRVTLDTVVLKMDEEGVVPAKPV